MAQEAVDIVTPRSPRLPALTPRPPLTPRDMPLTPRPPLTPRDVAAMPPAGKGTNPLNASFSAYDYRPARLDNGRSFLMDDYAKTGRVSRRNELEPSLSKLRRDHCWDVMHYQKNPAPFEPVQGFNETKFHTGFMRRQLYDIPHPPSQNKEVVLQREARTRRLQDARREALVATESFAYNGYNIITGEELDKSKDRAARAHHKRRHIKEPYDKGMSANAPGGRLRDSTSRFFCTAQQMPSRYQRQALLEADGLTHTKRKSSVIGVGSGPAHEIPSIGAREALSESLYRPANYRQPALSARF